MNPTICMMRNIRLKYYHDLAPLLLVVPATSRQHGSEWAHRRSAAPASPPALCLHSTVCNTHVNTLFTVYLLWGGLKILNVIFCKSTPHPQKASPSTCKHTEIQTELQTHIPVCLQVILPVSNHVRGSGQDGVAENLSSSLQLLWGDLQNTGTSA